MLYRVHRVLILLFPYMALPSSLFLGIILSNHRSSNKSNNQTKLFVMWAKIQPNYDPKYIVKETNFKPNDASVVSFKPY
jgi:hypothetical protein